MKVSIIVPVYNEEKTITDCLESLKKQTYKDFEIIIVDDGSSDKTLEVLKKSGIKFYQQEHLGPGAARNLGAKHAKGEILVFVDADMTFDKNFIRKLIDPIIKVKAIGTFSKEELVANVGNPWADCWSINEGWPVGRRHPKNYPNKQPVFRAILKKEFERVGGFNSSIGYTDDWTLTRKLGVQAVNAPGAVFYHQNPSSLKEVYNQSRWIGKNEFRTGNLTRKIFNLVRFSPPLSLVKGLWKAIKYKKLTFLFFKIVYDWGAWVSVIKSFFGEDKAK